MTSQQTAEWVLSRLLSSQSATRPAKPFVSLVDRSDAMTYGEADEQSQKIATYLTNLGIGPGDRVACFMSSSVDFVRLWLGAGRLGATFVPINLDLNGSFLQYQLDSCQAKVVAVDERSVRAVADVLDKLKQTPQLLMCGNPGADTNVAGLKPMRRFEEWKLCKPYQGPHPHASDIACIIFTSGTTGPSKGVLMPHAHCYLFGLGSVEYAEITEEDIYYIILPLFHVNGLFMQLYATLIGGAHALIRPRFSATAFFEEIVANKCTITNVLGSISAYLFAQPPSPHEKTHRLRLVQQTPNMPEMAKIWNERYGVDALITGYGMTEVNICAWSSITGNKPNSCGKPFSLHYDIMIADAETDQALPAGEVGEIMVRPKTPFAFMAGYDGMPQATASAWRNLWFHTGDAGMIDADGFMYFIDRMKDCIRRGGENISSYEVEQAIYAFGDIYEVAAFPIPADTPGTEEEVMLAIIPTPGKVIDPQALFSFACRALPRFAHPRYIEIFDEFPRTATSKVKKAELRKRGTSPQTVDTRRLVKSGVA